MARPDWNAESRPAFDPGIYHVEVRECEQRTSKKNLDPYFNVRLAPVGQPERTLAFDTIMLAGKGAGIGVGKLKSLGFGPEDGDIQPEHLIGRRAFVAVVMETYQDAERLKVDIRAEGSRCGYWNEDEPPDLPSDSLAPVEDAPW